MFGSDDDSDDGGLFGDADEKPANNKASASDAKKSYGGGLFGSDDDSDDGLFGTKDTKAKAEPKPATFGGGMAAALASGYSEKGNATA